MAPLPATAGSLLLLACLMAPHAVAQASSPSLLLTSSRTLTRPASPVPVPTVSPAVVATRAGFCAAWLDRRNDGEVFAARFDPSGRLLDPHPIAVGTYWPVLGVLEASNGCTVVWGLPWKSSGTFVPDGPDPRTEVRFSTDGGTLLTSSRTAALFAARTKESHSLRLIDADGRVTERAFPASPRIAAPADDGFVVVTGTDVPPATDLWRVAPDLTAVKIATIPMHHGQQPRVASDGEETAVALTGAWGEVTVVRVSPSGSEIGRTQFVPWGNTFRSMTGLGNGVYRLEWGGPDRTWVFETDTAGVNRRFFLDDIVEHASATSGTETFHLWRRYDTGLRYELATGTPSMNGPPLALAPPPEVLLDVEEGANAYALLWYERVMETRHVWVGLVRAGDLQLYAKQLVYSVSESEGREAMNVGIAAANDTVMVAWSRGGLLQVRRLASSGLWVDPEAVKLREIDSAFGGIDFSRDRLTAHEGGFALTWREPSSLRGATVDRFGTIGLFDVASRPWPHDWSYPAAIASHPDGILLAWQSFEAHTGVICCGDNRKPVFGGLTLHDSSFVQARELMPSGWKGAAMPQVATNRDSIVVAPGSQVGYTNGEPAYFHRVGNPAYHALPIIGGIAPLRWSGDAYRAVLIRTAPTPPSILTITREGTVSTTVLPALPTDAFERSNSADAWRYVFGAPKGLRLFMSGRTDDPDEGLVTRLRVHELQPFVTNRTRAVRR